MDKIRLGNDIEMRWSIFTRDGDNKVPYDLEGRALTLSVVNRKGESEIEFFAEGNIVTGVFRGRDQKILGKHGVILRENNGEDGMLTVDACDAFELVACSCEEALGSPGTIQLFHLTFDTTIGAITGTIDPILNYEAEQAEAERKANEIVRKSNEEQRIENENQRNADETLRKIAEEARESAEQERQAGEDLREANEAARVASEEARSAAEAIRAADESIRKEAEAARTDAEAARVEAEKARAEAEKTRVEAETARVEAEAERQAKLAAALVQETGQDTDKVMSQKAVSDALEGKQEKLVAGDNITIVGNVISSTGGGPGGSIDLSAYAKKEDVDAALEGKQDIIPDLKAIREGAGKGSTALQSESDPVYLADKPKLALKVEIPDVSGKVDKVTGKGLSSNDYTDADKLKLTGLENYDDTQIRELIAGKQDTISDLDAIRSNAQKGNDASNILANIVKAGYLFAGVATPSTDPGTPDAKVFYIANGKGAYTNFGGLEVTEDEVVILYYDTEWHKVSTGIASQAKLLELSQELLELEARVAALESGGSVPGETKYTISASVENGSVVATVNGASVDLPYKALENEVVKLEVIANSGYQFARWSDGVTENPREIKVVSDATYSAICESSAKTYTLRATSENGNVVAKVDGVEVSLPYVAAINTEVELDVQPIDGYEFTEWSNASNDNPRIVRMTTDKMMVAFCELAGNIPADYRSLRGIYSNSNNSYFDTGAAIDSHSKWDLYFGRTTHNTNNNALFGIRRGSGVSDTKANAFYHNSGSTWTSVAWVFGGTDTAAIKASGYGSKFKGNKHKLSQRGNDLYEWDRLICHLEKDFNNEDGVTALFGSLAKTKNTIYSSLPCQAIFYRFVFYDENDIIVKDLRPVQRVTDGQYGVYDIITDTFIPCIGTWNEWVDESASLRIVGQLNLNPTISSATTQTANYYNGYFVTTQDKQQDFIVAGGEITTDGTTINYPARQLLQCNEYNNNWHGNTSWFGADKWDASDFFPLLYVSTDIASQLLCVYRIKGADPQALEGVELVQKIYTPQDTPWYYNNYYGMAGVNTFVHTGYTQDSYTSADNDNTIMARVFRLPDPTIGDVTLYDSDALATVNLGFQSTTGDGYWTGKYLGITFSRPQSSIGRFVIWTISDSDTEIEPFYIIDGFHNTSSENFLASSELEGIKYDPFDDCFSLCMEPHNSGRTNLVYYRPFSLYTETKQW